MFGRVNGSKAPGSHVSIFSLCVRRLVAVCPIIAHAVPVDSNIASTPPNVREPFNQPETPVSLTVTRSGLKLPPSGALRPNHPSHVTVAGPPGAPVPEKAIFGDLALALVLLLREGWDSDTSW